MKNPFLQIHILVLSVLNFNVQIGAGRYLKGFGQASLSGARPGYMPPQLKTKTSVGKNKSVGGNYSDMR